MEAGVRWVGDITGMEAGDTTGMEAGVERGGGYNRDGGWG